VILGVVGMKAVVIAIEVVNHLMVEFAGMMVEVVKTIQETMRTGVSCYH
jgi:hypothetical protein